jgi:hypothetical protein
MTDVISGSFSEFDPQEAVRKIDEHLELLYKTRQDEKDAWFDRNREAVSGILWWKKNKSYTNDELEEIWNGSKSDWYFNSPKYRHWDHWYETIKAFNKIKSFCQLATAAGNKTVNLSKEDALFAYNWET